MDGVDPLAGPATLRVSEIFGPTVQGEGPLMGLPSVFVRLGGCDYRCAWCDTLHAVLPEHRAEWRPMGVDAVLARVDALTGGRPIMVTLSGGNPAIQPLGPLVEAGRAAGHRFAIETQGSIARDWFARLDSIVLSPKPPSAAVGTDWDALAACVAAGAGAPTALKLVVFDEADFVFAREAAGRHPGLPVFLQVGNDRVGDDEAPDVPALMARFRWLVDRVAAARWFEARVLPQLHVLAWGNERGV